MTTPPGKVRIIGGKWRRRKITFPSLLGLRPTHDRVRETLFNWLAPYIIGTNCLDLFSGSGALGFEALSRGAKKVTFVDRSPAIIAALKNNAEQLAIATKNIEIILGECPNTLPPLTAAPFEIVFLDPPFHQGLVQQAVQWLEQKQYLSENAFIYIETEIALSTLPVPSYWEILRSKQTASLAYYLLQCRPHGIPAAMGKM